MEQEGREEAKVFCTIFWKPVASVVTRRDLRQIRRSFFQESVLLNSGLFLQNGLFVQQRASNCLLGENRASQCSIQKDYITSGQ